MSRSNSIIPWGVVFQHLGDQDIHVFADLVVAIDGTWTGNCLHDYVVPAWMEDADVH